MYAETAERTLLEDWQVRRERLAGQPAKVEQFAELQVRILDYLVRRYRDAPQAARPARFSPKADLYVNQRAIVVHDHVWQGKVGGIKSRREAEARVSAILRRMTSADAQEHTETPPDPLMREEPSLVVECLAAENRAIARRWRGIASAVRRGRNVHAGVEATMETRGCA